ncbi:MAG: ABC-type uncharacterized transport system permease subunit [Myxococcota bacterium]|jgi:ABC-type uncharacterized transport system permease subunit
MGDTLVLAASLVYLAATVAFGAYLMRFSQPFARAGVIAVTIGLTLNVAAVVTRVLVGDAELGVYDLMLLGCALLVAGWLLIRFKRPSPLVGAFLTPVVTMVMYGLHVFQYEAALIRTEVAWVTPIHKVTSYIGFAVFAVAAGASVLQIAQEWRLKTKRLQLNAPSRLPSLPRLEKIAHRALVVGFPIYSVGMVLGAIWFADGESPVTRHFIMASFSWALYAVTLHARLVIGLQGRRAAVLTLTAFVTALFVVVLSILRMGA